MAWWLGMEVPGAVPAGACLMQSPAPPPPCLDSMNQSHCQKRHANQKYHLTPAHGQDQKRVPGAVLGRVWLTGSPIC